MKKTFEIPEIDIIKFNLNDVIATSGGNANAQFGNNPISSSENVGVSARQSIWE